MHRQRAEATPQHRREAEVTPQEVALTPDENYSGTGDKYVADSGPEAYSHDRP